MENKRVKNSSHYIILGTSGFASELGGLIIDSGLNIEGYVGPKINNDLPAPWVGDDSHLDKLNKDKYFLVAVGDPSKRESIALQCENLGFNFGIFVRRFWSFL